MRGSIIIICFFAVGVVLGLYSLIPTKLLDSGLSYYALCALMFCVGITIGCDPKTIKSFKTIDPKILLLPLATIVGTLVGCFVVGLFLEGRSVFDSMAVGSGFGYYSLSSIFITEYKGAELGTVGLLSNVIREIIALLGAPLFVRFFGKLSPISVGGATTMDTTLPVISRYSGKEFIVIAIYHGFMVDLSVPFLVTLFCKL